ncbi:hypothetical protein J6X15_04675 [Candidatus Saccharibacteria bacterium]|nr:hypothetical protein [Candidatus Saccharibacteria bacterium]
MEDSDKRTEGGIDFSESPNIVPHQDEEHHSDDSNNDKPKEPTTDGIPFAEEDIKFHSKTIADKEKKDLFVNVDKKAVRELERAKKKQENATARKLQEIEAEKNRKIKRAENERKNVERKAAIEARTNKEKQLINKIWARRKIILIAIFAILLILVIIFLVIPNIKGKIESDEKIATEKIVAENKTDMIKIFEKITGTEIALKDLKKTISEISKDALIDNYQKSGEIYINGTTERITFTTVTKNGIKYANNFVYKQVTDNGEIQIIKSEDMYYYFDGEDTIEYVSLEELINNHILSNLNKGK